MSSFDSSLTITELKHYALISVSGPDALKFLQGQLTCDMQNITETHHQLGAYCTLKGRVIALFRIFLKDNIYYLQFPIGLVENLLKKLKKHGMFSKISIQDESHQWQKIGVSGKPAAKVLSEILNKEIIYEVNKTEQALRDLQNDILILSLPGLEPRFELIAPSTTSSPPTLNQTLWETLSQRAEIQDLEYWKLLDIRAGIPEIWPETTEQLLPHYINLPHLNAVSFTKGCYCGQEIIARMEYRAKIKRRMIQAILLNTHKAPLPGTLLFEKTEKSSDPKKDVGTVITASSTAKGVEMLIEVLDEHATSWKLS